MAVLEFELESLKQESTRSQNCSEEDVEQEEKHAYCSYADTDH